MTKQNQFREAQQDRCFYCLVPFDASRPPTYDHVCPRSRGGSNRRENLVLACRACNDRKADKVVPEVWLTARYELFLRVVAETGGLHRFPPTETAPVVARAKKKRRRKKKAGQPRSGVLSSHDLAAQTAG